MVPISEKELEINIRIPLCMNNAVFLIKTE